MLDKFSIKLFHKIVETTFSSNFSNDLSIAIKFQAVLVKKVVNSHYNFYLFVLTNVMENLLVESWKSCWLIVKVLHNLYSFNTLLKHIFFINIMQRNVSDSISSSITKF